MSVRRLVVFAALCASSNAVVTTALVPMMQPSGIRLPLRMVAREAIQT